MLCVKNILGKQVGFIYTWLLVFLPVFIVIMAFIVDIGMVYALQNRIQTALDISATSALAANVKDDSLRQVGSTVQVDTDGACKQFKELLLTNLQAQAVGETIKLPNGEMTLMELKLQATGPPQLFAKYQVSYQTLLMEHVREPVFSIHTDTILTR